MSSCVLVKNVAVCSVSLALKCIKCSQSGYILEVIQEETKGWKSLGTSPSVSYF